MGHITQKELTPMLNHSSCLPKCFKYHKNKLQVHWKNQAFKVKEVLKSKVIILALSKANRLCLGSLESKIYYLLSVPGFLVPQFRQLDIGPQKSYGHPQKENGTKLAGAVWKELQSVQSNLVNHFFTNTQFPLFLIIERKEFHLKVITH